jgi:hypothetical protein
LKAARVLSGDVLGLRAADDWIRRSLLYREFQAEHEEILRHKWYESEKAGRDIGFDLAQMDWRIKHRSQWLRERRARRNPDHFDI